MVDARRDRRRLARWVLNLTGTGKTKSKIMKNLIRNLILAAAVAGFSGIAQAIPTLSFSDGINPSVVVTDNNLGGGTNPDNNATLGVVGFSGSIGTWSLASATSFTKPFDGTPTNPLMDTSYSVRTTAAGTLTISFTENGFNVPALFGYLGLINGNFSSGTGSVTYSAFANGVQIFTTGPLTTQGYGAAAGGFSATPGTVLEQRIVITMNGAGATSGDAVLTAVPDAGTTLLLLGAGLTGLALVSRSRKRVS
jgi:hypothetical protein